MNDRPQLPLVSACIGAYNREGYIRETIDSVLAQTYPNIEVVVVDDASTDGTVDVIASYGDRVRLIRRDTNSGICPVTRNQATRAAKGAYIAYLDSDDAWFPTKIEKQVEFMESHPAIPVCHTYAELIDAESRPYGIRHEGRLAATSNLFRSLLDHCWVTISSVMVRADIFGRVGGYFTEDRRYGIWGEEHEFLLRVSRQFEIGLVSEVLAKYRRHPDNIASGNWKCTPESVPFNKMIIDRRDIWEGVASRAEVVEAFVANCHANAEHWFYQGYGSRCMWFASEALKVKPNDPRAWRDLGRGLLRATLPRRDK